MKRSAYNCYKFCLAITLHFTQKRYDYFKYKGSGKFSSKKIFEEKDDYYLWENLAKREDCFEYIFYNCLEGNYHPRNFREEPYKKNKTIINNLEENFKQDFLKIQLPEDLEIKNGNVELIAMVFSGDISLQTYIILDKIYNLTDKYERELNQFFYEDFFMKVKKYSPFMIKDVSKFESYINNNDRIDH